jgi:hypothetical protein
MLVVVQAWLASQQCVCHDILSVPPTWVTLRPFLKSTYLPSMSPKISADGVRTPATLKVTLDGVRVLTSRVVPEVG